MFITSSFIGNQTGTDPKIPGQTYDFFFVTPKPQEYATITWAVYGGDDEFYVCTRAVYDYADGVKYYMNGFDLNGYFPVSWDLMDKPSSMEQYEGELFMFDAVIRLAAEESSASGAPRRVNGAPEGWKNTVSTSKYVVSPVNIDLNGGSIITAVRDVNAAKRQVESVQYVNLAGHVSNHPFEGMNIVVTRYTDGTTSTAKVLR